MTTNTKPLIDVHEAGNAAKLAEIGELATAAARAQLQMVVALGRMQDLAMEMHDEVEQYTREGVEDAMTKEQARAWNLAALALFDCKHFYFHAQQLRARQSELETIEQTLRECLAKM